MNTYTNSETKIISASDDEMVRIAREAYIFAFPIIMMDISRRQMTDAAYSPTAVPVNVFKHISKFPDASYRGAVRPNADTYYSSAWLDLRNEPMVLSIPYTRGRYYMMPMLDAYTNVFASPGKRTNGANATDFIITGPHWKGFIPENMRQILSPTNMVWILGRTQVNNKEDGAEVVVPLQQQFKLVPLSVWGKHYTIPEPQADPSVPKGNLKDIVREMPIEDFFNYFNSLLPDNPPDEAAKEVTEKFTLIGVWPGEKFNLSDFNSDIQEALKKIPEDVFVGLKQRSNDPSQVINGWRRASGKLGAYGTDYEQRAYAAFIGLGANLREDTIYNASKFDDEGHELNGKNKYIIRFKKGQTPPTNAFWSLTMYNPDGYMIDNPINRNTIGDRMHLNRNEDGSIDIYLQHKSPGKHKEENWLPAPSGDFNILLRVYWPKEEMINGTWQLPPVKKVNTSK